MNKREFLKKLPDELLDYLILNEDKIYYLLYLFETNMIKSIVYSDELDVYLLKTSDDKFYSINESGKLKNYLRDKILEKLLK